MECPALQKESEREKEREIKRDRKEEVYHSRL